MVGNKISSIINRINQSQGSLENLSDQQLKDKTKEFKLLFSQETLSKTQEEKILDQILPDVFATAKEAFKRTFDIDLTDMQLIGAYHLHKGNIVQMNGGEGKGFSIFLSAYLNSLTQKGVHVAVFDDINTLKYLTLYKIVYNFLGIKAEYLSPKGQQEDIQEILKESDIIYSEIQQFAIGYVFNTTREPENKLQKPLNYIITDNSDVNLIDILYTSYSISKDNQLLDKPLMHKDFINKYAKCSGVTTSVGGEKNKFKKLYNLNTVILPTNKPDKRIEYNDILYRSEIIKFRRLIDEIKTVHSQQRPIVVMVTNADKLKYLSVLLKKNNIPFNYISGNSTEEDLLNIAIAGKKGAVSIVSSEQLLTLEVELGGDFEYFARKELKRKMILESNFDWNDSYKKEIKNQKTITEQEAERISELGGLHVISIEHYKSDRYDEQLKQLSAQKGYNGSSRFFTSIEDKVFETIKIDKIADLIASITKNSDEVIKMPFWLKIINFIIKNSQRQYMDENKQVTNFNADFTGLNVKAIKNKEKINRNSPCPCGSGKKYKKCCMKKENL